MLEQADELSSEVKVSTSNARAGWWIEVVKSEYPPPMLEQVDELSSEVKVSTSNARAGWWIE